MERRRAQVLQRSVVGVDPQPPGQARRLAEELLVPPVADPADALREQQAGRRRVHERRRARTRAAHDDHPGDRPEEDPAPDAEPAVPELEHALPFRRRHLVPRGDVVVEPRPDDAEPDAPERDAQHEIAVAPHAAPADARQPDAEQDRDQQRQAVQVDDERPDVEDAARRRRNRCDRHRHRGRLCTLRMPCAAGASASRVEPPSDTGADTRRADASVLRRARAGCAGRRRRGSRSRPG